MKIHLIENTCLFGKILLETRKRLNISQYKLSKLSGISERYLNFLEHGKVEPRVSTVIKISDALGLLPGDLINPLAERLKASPNEMKDKPKHKPVYQSIPDQSEHQA